MKCRALSDGGSRPNLAAVPPHDPLHRRKADPSSGKLGGAVHTLERSEKLRGVGHVESGAVVANEEGDLLSILWAA